MTASAISPRSESKTRTGLSRGLKTVGLFAGIGGLELGLERAGHSTVGLCEIDPAAAAVLKSHFKKVRVTPDVQDLESLPAGTGLLTAGFPCQDLSQAGRTLGINNGDSRSGLVGEVIRLLYTHDPRWVLLENVPFMLHLAKGKSLEVLISALEDLGFSWAYRVVNSNAFGVPQRRERLYLLASRTEDPRRVLLVDDVGEPDKKSWDDDLAAGFYWTEGTGGLGWAVDAIPTLKSGSSIGIASPPAIVLPSELVVTPSLTAAERFQGFDADWTEPAEEVAPRRMRWRLVGNAVTVNVAEWIGTRLRDPSDYEPWLDSAIPSGTPWPRAAYNVGGGRFASKVSAWPISRPAEHLHTFIKESEGLPLSHRAVSGFLSRYEAGSLRKIPKLLRILRAHKKRMSGNE